MTMKHEVWIRFNNSKLSDVTTGGQKTCTEEWCKDRVHLFRKYTLPSLEQQSEQKFNIALFIDPSTSQEVRDGLNDGGGLPYVNLIEGRNYDKRFQDLKSKETDVIITTRCDSDDALHRDFIGVIQHVALQGWLSGHKKRGFGIDCPFFQYIESSGKCARREVNYPSQFSSVVSQQHHIYEGPHTTLHKRITTFKVPQQINGEEKYLAMQVVHGQNTADVEYPGKQIYPDLADYGLGI